MKIQTMTLPTGQFVLVISEATGTADTYREGLEGVGDQIGAAGVLVFAQPVDVEDSAIYDRSRRTDVEIHEDWVPALAPETGLADLETGELKNVEAGISNRTADIIARIVYDHTTGGDQSVPSRRQYEFDLESDETRVAWRGWAINQVAALDLPAPKVDLTETLEMYREVNGSDIKAGDRVKFMDPNLDKYTRMSDYGTVRQDGVDSDGNIAVSPDSNRNHWLYFKPTALARVVGDSKP